MIKFVSDYELLSNHNLTEFHEIAHNRDYQETLSFPYPVWEKKEEHRSLCLIQTLQYFMVFLGSEKNHPWGFEKSKRQGKVFAWICCCWIRKKNVQFGSCIEMKHFLQYGIMDLFMEIYIHVSRQPVSLIVCIGGRGPKKSHWSKTGH